MHASWVILASLFVLGMCVLAVIGLVALLRLISGRSSLQGKRLSGASSLEDLKRVLEEHEQRLDTLEKARPSPGSVRRATAHPPSSRPSLPRPKADPNPPSKNLEEAMAGRWFQWIALAALLFGLGYFLKLAFENNWIGPMGRVALGWISGSLFLVLGHRWFTRYPVWAQSLAGGGLAFLYLSTYAAFQFYHLLGGTVAFALMILTTAAGSLLAAADRSRVLATCASLGGFLTPALLSSGEDQQVALMGYLLVLNVGILFLSVFGNWRFLRWGASLFTVIYCIGYGDRFYQTDKLWITLAFHTAFYLLFAAANWIQDFGKRKDVDAADALFTLLNAGVYYGSTYALLTAPAFDHAYDLLAAVLALVLAGLYAWQSARVLKSKVAESTYLSAILLGLAVSFFALAIPAYFNRSWITVGWSLEAVLLVWAGLREARPATRKMGYMVLGLAGARLVLYDWTGVTQTLIWNERLVPYGAVLGSVTAAILLLARWRPRPDEAGQALPLLAIAGNLAALLYLSLEVADFWNRRPTVSLLDAKALSLSALWLLYAGGMMVAGFLKDLKGLRLVAIMTFWVTIAKVFLFDLSKLEGGYRVLSLILLGLILLAVSFAYQRRAQRGRTP